MSGGAYRFAELTGEEAHSVLYRLVAHVFDEPPLFRSDLEDLLHVIKSCEFARGLKSAESALVNARREVAEECFREYDDAMSHTEGFHRLKAVCDKYAQLAPYPATPSGEETK